MILAVSHQLTDAFKADQGDRISKEKLIEGLVTIAGKSESAANAEVDKVSLPGSSPHAHAFRVLAQHQRTSHGVNTSAR
jgi:hypothetical protein